MKQGQLRSMAVAAMMCAASAVAPSTLLAQVLTTNGYATIPNPISPNCTPPNTWTAYNGHFMCAQPQPTCQYGFAASPVLNASGAWSYACNGPPPPPPPVVTPPQGGNPTVSPAQMCATRAAAAGFTLGPQTRGPYYPSGQPWAQRYYDNSVGPTWQLVNGTFSNAWSVICIIDESTMTWAPNNMNPFLALQPSQGEGGGG
jgi:hypothetical protein